MARTIKPVPADALRAVLNSEHAMSLADIALKDARDVETLEWARRAHTYGLALAASPSQSALSKALVALAETGKDGKATGRYVLPGANTQDKPLVVSVKGGISTKTVSWRVSEARDLVKIGATSSVLNGSGPVDDDLLRAMRKVRADHRAAQRAQRAGTGKGRAAGSGRATPPEQPTETVAETVADVPIKYRDLADVLRAATGAVERYATQDGTDKARAADVKAVAAAWADLADAMHAASIRAGVASETETVAVAIPA